MNSNSENNLPIKRNLKLVYVLSFIIARASHDRVLFEGSLGELEELSMVDGAVLEVKGANGVLRIDPSEGELRKMLSQKEAE